MKLQDIENAVVREQAETILSMFKDFNIEMTLDEVIETSRFTHIQMKMVKRRKMKEFALYHDDLCYALGVASGLLEIKAPVFGKTQVGVTITKYDSIIPYNWTEAIASDEYVITDNDLMVPLGKNDTDENVYIDIARQPHLMIGGSYMSGKTNLLHNFICSLITNKTPDQLQLLFSDSHDLEMSVYNDCPHVLIDSITNAKKALEALKLLNCEMDRRYDLLLKNQTRDINEYHSKIYLVNKENGVEVDPMPYILFVIEEFSELMVAYPNEIESQIVKLAQVSRAVGIHLIISSDQATRKVFTDSINVNMQSKIALKVYSKSQSEVLFDHEGAENLLISGDMYYLDSVTSRPLRVHAPLITKKDIIETVKISKDTYAKSNSDEVISLRNKLSTGECYNYDEDEIDDKYEEAKAIVIKAKKASTSYLQRRMSIGYSRSAKLIDLLEENKVIGPSRGSKVREVYQPKD